MIDLHEEPFEEVYERHRTEVWALVYAYCMNSETALEIMQEAFLRLWEQRERGQRILHPRAWLRRVARNLVKDHNRCAFHRHGTRPPEFLGSVHADEPLPHEHLEQQELYASLHEALAQLPHGDREVLTLRYGMGFSGKKIGRLLAMNTNAVHMRACRARQRLAGLLAAGGVRDIA